MTSRLPIEGSDQGSWGSILNDFLSVSHSSNGALQTGSVGASQIQDGTVSSAKLATAVQTTLAKATSAVQSVNAKLPDGAGAVTLTPADIAAAPLASPALTGTPTAPTPAPGDNSTKIATTAYVAAAASGTTKQATLSFGSPNQTPLAAGTNQINARVIHMLHSTPIRYRFKVSNASAQNGTNPGTPITLNSAWIGKPAYDDTAHNNKWLGNMTTTPTQVYSANGALPTSGTTDLVTPWITNAGEITGKSPFVLSVGVTPTAGGSGVLLADCYGAMQYGPTSANQAGIAAPGAGYNYAGFILDVRMEYEFVARATDLTAFVIGASGESGYSPTGDLSANPRPLNDPLDAWPALWAYRQGYQVINGGIFASATTDWLSVGSRPYARFDLATTVPDIAIIGSMVSNDLNLGTSMATIKANYETIIANLQSLGIKRIFGVTIPPRSLSGGNETNRVALNAYLRAIPAGLEDVFDFDVMLRTPGATSTMLADFVSADNVHPVRSGYRLLGSIPRISA